jgi:curved DNA-binding protein
VDDPYEVLGVARTASPADVVRAYRRRARSLHPDTAAEGGDPVAFSALADAYAVLGDADRRADHDRAEQGRASPAGRRPGRGVPVPVRRVARPRPGADVAARLRVPFPLSVTGGVVEVLLEQGAVRVRRPAGVEDGSPVRVPGLGGPGTDGGPPGDLVLAVEVTGDPRFGRAGRDVTTTLTVRWPDAVLGAELPVDAPTGPATVHVPPGTCAGAVLRVSGRGVQVPGAPGDLVVTVAVDVPTVLSDDERAAVTALSHVLRPWDGQVRGSAGGASASRVRDLADDQGVG